MSRAVAWIGQQQSQESRFHICDVSRATAAALFFITRRPKWVLNACRSRPAKTLDKLFPVYSIRVVATALTASDVRNSAGSVPAKGKRALQVAHAIVLDIERDRRVAGDRLPQEEDMLARYEVARATLREALRFLELQGVIYLQLGRGGGPVVRRPQTSDFASSLALILHFLETSLRSLLEMREAMAPEMAARAAQRATTADVAALIDCLEQLEQSFEGPEFEQINRRFHDLLGWASGNPLFGLLTSALHLLTRGLSDSLGYSPQERAVQLRYLSRVLQAIKVRDPQSARRQMEKLVAGSADYLAQRSPELIDQKIRWDTLRR